MAETQYVIAIDGGDKLFVIGKTGEYEEELSKAMIFNDKFDAIVFIEKHGYQRIASIRKVISKAV